MLNKKSNGVEIENEKYEIRRLLDGFVIFDKVGNHKIEFPILYSLFCSYCISYVFLWIGSFSFSVFCSLNSVGNLRHHFSFSQSTDISCSLAKLTVNFIHCILFFFLQDRLLQNIDDLYSCIKFEGIKARRWKFFFIYSKHCFPIQSCK